MIANADISHTKPAKSVTHGDVAHVDVCHAWHTCPGHTRCLGVAQPTVGLVAKPTVGLGAS